MSNIIETGHAKNVDLLDDMISFLISYGKDYNPAREMLTIKALKELHSQASKAVKELNSLLPAYKTAIADRREAFKPLSMLITRVINSLEASGENEHMVNNAKSIARKIKGIRAKPIKADEESEDVRHISTSQMSYDSRVNNLSKLIALLSNIKLYKPNEKELKVEALIALRNTLKKKNDGTSITTPPVSNARIKRDKILYADDTGLYSIVKDVKLYVRSIYGQSSPQFKQISSLKFSKRIQI